MIQLVEKKREDIAALCREYGVKQLEIFGSAATGDFNPETSDLDFIVEFLDYGPGISKRFLGFADAIEALFGRSADFLSNRKEITNPYLRRSVDATRELLYDATKDRQAIA